MIDNIIYNTIYQINRCRYHVFLHTNMILTKNNDADIIIHITSYQKIINDVNNMSLIKYSFFQNTASCSIKKHYLGGGKQTYSPTYHLVKLDLQSKCFYKF